LGRNSDKKAIFRLTGLVKSFTFSMAKMLGKRWQSRFFYVLDCEKSHMLESLIH
jgi:hypothetical protein